MIYKDSCLAVDRINYSLSCWQNVTPFTLHASLVYFQMNNELLLYFKLTRVDMCSELVDYTHNMGNVSKKDKYMKGIIT